MFKVRQLVKLNVLQNHFYADYECFWDEYKMFGNSYMLSFNVRGIILKSKNTNNKHAVCSWMGYGVMYNYLGSANVAYVLLITKGKSLAIPNFSIIKFHQLLTIPSKGPQFLL